MKSDATSFYCWKGAAPQVKVWSTTLWQVVVHSFVCPLSPACDPGEEEGKGAGQGHRTADWPGGHHAALGVHVDLRFWAEQTQM